MTREKQVFKIHEIVRGDTAVSVSDGDGIFGKISKAFEKDKDVELDFSEINLLTTSFLNSAVGQLYDQYDSDFLNAHFNVVNIAKEDRPLLKKVIERAKSYFKDRESFESSVRESSEDYE